MGGLAAGDLLQRRQAGSQPTLGKRRGNCNFLSVAAASRLRVGDITPFGRM